MTTKTTDNLPPLPQVTTAQIVASRLRRMARDLILEAEALEATVPRPKGKRKELTFEQHLAAAMAGKKI